ncbi:unnamed protein product [Pylaiella littoralis]
MATSRMLRKVVLSSAGAIGTASVGAAYVYRPDPWSNPPRDPLSERPGGEEESFLMKTSRVFTFVAGTAAFSFLMHVVNTFELKEDEHYEKLLGLVKDRPKGVPLLTVSNHCSPLDDPGVLVGMLPASVTVRPELMRWTICAQEICFKWASAGTGFGSAKVMPIARGNGIDQRLLLNFYRRLLGGGWCHIFPEGHCEQDGSLGGRPAGLSRDKHGRLKWGVGKMIAHSPVTPVVIPLFHTGMGSLIPINPFTRKILHAVPRTGNTVTARAGGAIRFDDLLEDHERRHGPLRKLALPPPSAAAPGGGKGGGGGGGRGVGGAVVLEAGREGDVLWKSTREERQLYSRIARRVEDALLQLEAEARRELGDDYPGWPAEPAAMLLAAKAKNGATTAVGKRRQEGGGGGDDDDDGRGGGGALE